MLLSRNFPIGNFRNDVICIFYSNWCFFVAVVKTEVSNGSGWPWTQYLAEDDLKLLILLPQLPGCCDDSHRANPDKFLIWRIKIKLSLSVLNSSRSTELDMYICQHSNQFKWQRRYTAYYWPLLSSGDCVGYPHSLADTEIPGRSSPYRQ